MHMGAQVNSITLADICWLIKANWYDFFGPYIFHKFIGIDLEYAEYA